MLAVGSLIAKSHLALTRFSRAASTAGQVETDLISDSQQSASTYFTTIMVREHVCAQGCFSKLHPATISL